MFTLKWTDTKTGETAICEVHDGLCYELHATEAAAQAEAKHMNDLGKQYGWASKYEAVPLPDNIKPAFDPNNPEPDDEARTPGTQAWAETYSDNRGESYD